MMRTLSKGLTFFREHIPSVVSDVVAVVFLTIVSLFIISFYFPAQYLNTGYPDWLVHAYRARALSLWGYTSWNHVWSNGINLWQGYQFLPHVLTAVFASVFNVEIPRMMVLVTIVSFVLLRLFLYGMLRILGIGKVPALLSALWSFAIGQYWSGVNEYTLLFGFTLFPLIVLSFIALVRRATYLYVFLSAMTIYIHPIFSFYSILLWVCYLLVSDRKIISLSSIVELAVYMGTTSFFWIPVVTKGAYGFTSTFFTQRSFLNLVIANYEWAGLSATLILLAIVGFIRIFTPLREKHTWANMLTVYAAGMSLLVVIGTHIDLPAFMNVFQYTRGITYIGLSIVIITSTVLDALWKSRNLLIRSVIVFCCVIGVTEGIWFASVHAAPGALSLSDPVREAQTNYPEIHLESNRVWTPDIGTSSYLGANFATFPYSYMSHFESNQIPLRLTTLLLYYPFSEKVPSASIRRMDDYFRATATQYAFFDELSVLSQTLLEHKEYGYTSVGKVELPLASYRIFRTPWVARNAVLVDDKTVGMLTRFPTNLKETDVRDQIELDEYIKRFSDLLYQEGNTPLAIRYPNQEELEVVIPQNRASDTVYIAESYSPSWKASLSNVTQTITSVGPNYMSVHLSLPRTDGGTLTLVHRWPIQMYIAAVSVVFIGMGCVGVAVGQKIRRNS